MKHNNDIERSIIKKIPELLNRASSDPVLRDNLIWLGEIADQLMYPNPLIWKQAVPNVLAFARDVGLLEDSVVLNQKEFDRFINCLLENANELAYCAKGLKKLTPGKLYQKAVGEVFLSWTVKNPRDREATIGIKKALDYFNVNYFDYIGFYLEDYLKLSKQIEIKNRLRRAVTNAKVSIEVRSAEFGNTYWIEFEQDLIAKNSRLYRIFVCLDKGIASLLSQDPSLEQRTLRVDMSDDRAIFGATKYFDIWMAKGADVTHFKCLGFLGKCFDLAWHVRKLLDTETNAYGIKQLFYFITLQRKRERQIFLQLAQHT